MSESNVPSGDSNAAGGQDGKSGTVSYETLQKAINQEKAAKKRAEELAQKLAELEAEKKLKEEHELALQGKHKELAEAKEKESKQLKEELAKVQIKFGRQSLNAAIRQVALEMGARAKAVDDIIKAGNWSDVKIDENFTPDVSQIKSVIAGMQQEKDYFFETKAAPVKDVSLSANGISAVQVGDKPLHQLTADEIIQLAKKLDIK